MTTHEKLIEARQRLADGHHVKRMMVDHRGGFCAFGAIIGTADGFRCGDHIGDHFSEDSDEYRACRALQDANEKKCVVAFNNEPETTKEHVLALFDKAIAATAPAPDMSWLEEPAAEYLVS